VARGIDDLDESQVRQAAKLLERENERLVRRVLELEQTLSTVQNATERVLRGVVLGRKNHYDSR
jgi:hypothetical protein